MSPISPEITMIMILLLCVKLALKHAAYVQPEPTRKPRKTRSDKGTRRVKHLPHMDSELDIRESVQVIE